MLKVLRKSAKTEDEALRLALEELGLERDDVSVQIIERAKSGFLGIGSSPAVVEVTYEVPDEVVPEAPVRAEKPPEPAKPEPAKSEPAKPAEVKPPPKPEPRESKPVAKQPAPKEAKAPAIPRETAPPESAATQTAGGAAADRNNPERIREFLLGLTSRMGVTASVTVGDETDGTVKVTIESGEPGALIGRRGETLDAIQSLTNYTVNRGARQRLRVIVDAENYRERRGETLEALAARTAGKVARYRRSITLDPMNAYERHVIHAALQEHESVSTHSVGSEPNRRVVVTYGKKPQQEQSSQRPDRRKSAPRPEPRESGGGKPRPEPQQDAYTATAESENYREWK